uniref:Uncharacterized protein n=1 Tax=Leptobrachium leishanense TaxID=445787 RepID=A0A8C5Q705_9ANUR
MLIERIKHYYEAAEANASFLTKEDSISYIPTGVVKDSILRFNYILQQEVKKDKEWSLCEGSGCANDGKRASSPVGSQSGVDRTSEQPVALVEDGSIKHALEQDLEYKTCAEIRKAWKEKEKNTIPESCAILKRQKPCRKGSEDNVLVIVEESDLESGTQAVKEESVKRETKREQKRNNSEIKSNKQDSQQQTEEDHKMAFCPSGLGLYETEDICLIENSDKIINKVQLLARMYSEKIGKMKSQKRNGERRPMALNKATTRSFPQVNEDKLGDRNMRGPQQYGHVLIRETLLHINCVQENGLLLAAPPQSSSDLSKGDTGVNSKSMLQPSRCHQNPRIQSSGTEERVTCLDAAEIQTVSAVTGQERVDLECSVHECQPMPMVEYQPLPMLECQPLPMVELQPAAGENIPTTPVPSTPASGPHLSPGKNEASEAYPKGDVQTKGLPELTKENKDIFNEQVEVNEEFVTTQIQTPEDSIFSEQVVHDKKPDSSNSNAEQETEIIKENPHLDIAETMSDYDPESVYNDSEQTEPVTMNTKTSEEKPDRAQPLQSSPARDMLSLSAPSEEEVSDQQDTQHQAGLHFENDSVDTHCHSSLTPKSQACSPSVLDVMQRLQLDSSFSIVSKDISSKKTNLATRSSSFKSKTTSAENFKNVHQGSPHENKQQKPEFGATPKILAPLALHRKLSSAAALSKYLPETHLTQCLTRRSPMAKAKSSDAELQTVPRPEASRQNVPSSCPPALSGNENQSKGLKSKLMRDATMEEDPKQDDTKPTQNLSRMKEINAPLTPSSTNQQRRFGDQENKLLDSPVSWSPGSTVLIAFPCPSSIKQTPTLTASEPNSRVQSPQTIRSRMCSPPPHYRNATTTSTHIPSSKSRPCSFTHLCFGHQERSSSSSTNSTPTCTSPTSFINPRPEACGFHFHTGRTLANCVCSGEDEAKCPKNALRSPTWSADRISQFSCTNQSSSFLVPEVLPHSSGINPHELTGIQWPDVRELRSKYGPLECQNITSYQKKSDRKPLASFRPFKSLGEEPEPCGTRMSCLDVTTLHTSKEDDQKDTPHCNNGEKIDPTDSRDKATLKASYSTTVNIQIGGSGRISSFSTAQISLAHPSLPVTESQSLRKISVKGNTFES